MEQTHIQLSQKNFMFKVHATPSMEKLETLIYSKLQICTRGCQYAIFHTRPKSLKLKVDLIKFGYYQTEKGYKDLLDLYPQGWVSNNPLLSAFHTKSNFEAKYEVFTVKFILDQDTPKHAIKQLEEVCRKLHVTPPGSMQGHYPYGTFNHVKVVNYNYTQVDEYVYYYKKDGFDKAYNALKELIGNLSEETFARILWDRKYCNGGYNDDLILESKCEMIDLQLFKRRTEKVDKIKYVQQYDCYISIIATDIERNMETFAEFFEIVSDYIVR